VGQRGRVDLVGLDPRLGDGLDLQRVGQRDLSDALLEPIVHDAPAASGLQHSRTFVASVRPKKAVTESG